jgi:hypothetical protein
MVIGLSAAVEKFISYWRSLPRQGLVPDLSTLLNDVQPDLQPFLTVLDVLSPNTVQVRLLGTGLVRLLGRELTKTNSIDIYAPHLRARVGRACTTMVSLPCGQVTERLITTRGGLIMAATSAALPVRVKSDQLGALVAYTATREPVATSDAMTLVNEILATEWVDIGAGVPNVAT